MGKKIVHFEVDDRLVSCITELNSELSRLLINATDSYDFEDILNKAVHSLYKAQPQGQENYGGENPRFGSVWLCRANVGLYESDNTQGPGNASIEFTPSTQYEAKCKYIQTTMGTVNLRERSYSLMLNRIYDKSDPIPEVLMMDTEKVMECLGLTRKQKK
ncbi:MAG: hypothetical protein KKE93_01580 [Nanoarchaeota archaeon]|nr:hypothetical protein [Nanoarchaeota archaeon]